MKRNLKKRVGLLLVVLIVITTLLIIFLGKDFLKTGMVGEDIPEKLNCEGVGGVCANNCQQGYTEVDFFSDSCNVFKSAGGVVAGNVIGKTKEKCCIPNPESCIVDDDCAQRHTLILEPDQFQTLDNLNFQLYVGDDENIDEFELGINETKVFDLFNITFLGTHEEEDNIIRIFYDFYIERLNGDELIEYDEHTIELWRDGEMIYRDDLYIFSSNNGFKIVDFNNDTQKIILKNNINFEGCNELNDKACIQVSRQEFPDNLPLYYFYNILEFESIAWDWEHDPISSFKLNDIEEENNKIEIVYFSKFNTKNIELFKSNPFFIGQIPMVFLGNTKTYKLNGQERSVVRESISSKSSYGMFFSVKEPFEILIAKIPQNQVFGKIKIDNKESEAYFEIPLGVSFRNNYPDHNIPEIINESILPGLFGSLRFNGAEYLIDESLRFYGDSRITTSLIEGWWYGWGNAPRWVSTQAIHLTFPATNIRFTDATMDNPIIMNFMDREYTIVGAEEESIMVLGNQGSFEPEEQITNEPETPKSIVSGMAVGRTVYKIYNGDYVKDNSGNTEWKWRLEDLDSYYPSIEVYGQPQHYNENALEIGQCIRLPDDYIKICFIGLSPEENEYNEFLTEDRSFPYAIPLCSNETLLINNLKIIFPQMEIIGDAIHSEIKNRNYITNTLFLEYIDTNKINVYSGDERTFIGYIVPKEIPEFARLNNKHTLILYPPNSPDLFKLGMKLSGIGIEELFTYSIKKYKVTDSNCIKENYPDFPTSYFRFSEHMQRRDLKAGYSEIFPITSEMNINGLTKEILYYTNVDVFEDDDYNYKFIISEGENRTNQIEITSELLNYNEIINSAFLCQDNMVLANKINPTCDGSVCRLRQQNQIVQECNGNEYCINGAKHCFEDNPITVTTDNNFFMINGERFFPIGKNSGLYNGEDNFEKELGYNFMLTGSLTEDPATGVVECAELLYKLQQEGLYASLWLPVSPLSYLPLPKTEFIDNYLLPCASRSPAMFMYYVDELALAHNRNPEDSNFMSPEEYSEFYNDLRFKDPKHLMWNNEGPTTDDLIPMNKTRFIEDLKNYPGDTKSVDIYPGIVEPRCAWLTDNPTLKCVGEYVDMLKESVNNEKPVTMYLWGNPDGGAQIYTEMEHRFMAFDSIVHGATGIVYWNTIDGGETDSDLRPTIMQLSELKDVLVQDTIEHQITNVYGIRTLIKKYNDEYYAITVNENNYSVAVEFSNLFNSNSAEVLFENRVININNNRFQDSFLPLDVHIYKLTASSGYGE